jgi:hypothetical protein
LNKRVSKTYEAFDLFSNIKPPLPEMTEEVNFYDRDGDIKKELPMFPALLSTFQTALKMGVPLTIYHNLIILSITS